MITVPFSGTSSTTVCSGTVYDHGGNSNYSDNANGTLTIYPSTAGSNIQLTFTSFNLESNYDYLYIYNGTSTSASLIGTYSGTNNPGTVSASNANGALTLRFTSDGSATFSGFTASISCISGSMILVPISGSSSVTTCSGTVYDNGGSSNYSNNANGILTINPSTAGSNVRLSFTSFYTEGSFDTLFIYNGTSTTSPLIGHYSGLTGPGTVTASNANGALTLRFKSDISVTYSGFEASISCVGSGLLADLIINSPTVSPTIANAGSTITVNSVIRNQGSGNAASSNIGYYLSSDNVYDINDTYLGNSIGGSLAASTEANRSQSLSIPVATTSGSYYIIYYADYANAVSESNENNNFNTSSISVATIIIVPQTGSASITACSGTVYDNGGLGDYKDNSSGSLTINPSTLGDKIRLTFTSFDLETCCDSLVIYDGASFGVNKIGKYTSNPGTITSNSPSGSLTLTFYSDYSVFESGFTADISCVTPTSINNSTFNSSVKVYPNPNQGKFNVEVNNLNEEIMIITIMDALGVVVDSRKERINNGNYDSAFDISQYASGVYSVKVEAGNKQTIVKVVVK